MEKKRKHVINGIGHAYVDGDTIYLVAMDYARGMKTIDHGINRFTQHQIGRESVKVIIADARYFRVVRKSVPLQLPSKKRRKK